MWKKFFWTWSQSSKQKVLTFFFSYRPRGSINEACSKFVWCGTKNGCLQFFFFQMWITVHHVIILLSIRRWKITFTTIHFIRTMKMPSNLLSSSTSIHANCRGKKNLCIWSLTTVSFFPFNFKKNSNFLRYFGLCHVENGENIYKNHKILMILNCAVNVAYTTNIIYSVSPLKKKTNYEEKFSNLWHFPTNNCYFYCDIFAYFRNLVCAQCPVDLRTFQSVVTFAPSNRLILIKSMFLFCFIHLHSEINQSIICPSVLPLNSMCEET